MSVKCDLGSGTVTVFDTNDQLVKTQRGMIRADELVQGDFVRYMTGQPLAEVMAPPVVS